LSSSAIKLSAENTQNKYKYLRIFLILTTDLTVRCSALIPFDRTKTRDTDKGWILGKRNVDIYSHITYC